MREEKDIRWGIIGCGDVTEIKSGPAYQKTEGFQLTAVMRRNADKAKDFDIVVLFDQELSDLIIQKVNVIKMDFKIKFKCNLHETLFFCEEKKEFSEFVDYNQYKLKGNG